MEIIQWQSKVLKSATVHKQAKILELCKGKKVLDVGCVGQDIDPNDKNWLHGNIKQVASSLKGCDINVVGIDSLKKQGWDIVQPDELLDLNQQYDVIVMGDVIEHVNDPGSFLSFYAQFLSPNGILIVCTPNAYGVRYHLQVLFFGKPSTNPEHTLFLDPFVMLEMVSRIKLEFHDFYWLYEYTKPFSFPQRIIRVISACFIAIRKYFRPNFLVVLKQQ
jgi:SAM-dependent methyltransferase